MKEHEVTIGIAVDPDQLVSFVADLSHDARWRHDMAFSELVSGRPGEAGSVYRQKGTTPGRDDPYLIELLSVDRPGRTVTFATVDRTPVAYGGRYRIVDKSPGAEITMGVWLKGRGRLRFIAPLLGKAVKANSIRYLNDLKLLLEAG